MGLWLEYGGEDRVVTCNGYCMDYLIERIKKTVSTMTFNDDFE